MFSSSTNVFRRISTVLFGNTSGEIAYAIRTAIFIRCAFFCCLVARAPFAGKPLARGAVARYRTRLRTATVALLAAGRLRTRASATVRNGTRTPRAPSARSRVARSRLCAAVFASARLRRRTFTSFRCIIGFFTRRALRAARVVRLGGQFTAQRIIFI